MQELIAALTVWAAAATGLPVPEAEPSVRFVDACAIHQTTRPEGKCTDEVRAIAYYEHEMDTIYLPHEWDASNLYHVSGLLHEIIHHMQAEEGQTPQTVGCAASALEKPAYDAQIAFLEAAGVDAYEVMGINGLALMFFTTCEQMY